MSQLSVIICTHNPRIEYLERVIQSLQQQTLSPEKWQLTIIDNASEQPISEQISIPESIRSVCIVEAQLGLTPARIRGILETEGDYLLFIDDDNILAPHYLENCVSIFERHPFLGCIGAATIVPEFEEEPIEELKKWQHMLAIRKEKRTLWSNDPSDQIIPWGAGLACRRNVANRFAEQVANDPVRINLGRKGKVLTSGEDDLFSFFACEQNLGKGLFLELTLTHIIPQWRVTPEYMIKIYQGHCFSDTILECVNGRSPVPIQAPPSLGELFASILRGKLSQALHLAKTLNDRRKQTELQLRFQEAMRNGRNEALEEYKKLVNAP